MSIPLKSGMADLKNSNTDSQQVLNEVKAFGSDLEKLRSQYDLYFQGLEKFEPYKLRLKVDETAKKISNLVVQGAQVKFLLQQKVARYNTLKIHWDKILREMEEGVSKRDQFKAKIKYAPDKAPKVKSPIELLYEKYIQTRKKLNEPTENITLDKFQKTIEQQMKVLQEKAKGKKISFKVDIENGKSKLKATLK